MRLILIRHSLTEGNLAHRYVGRKTDEPLCPAGVALAAERAVEIQQYTPEQLFVSPMRRCRETASILFPTMVQQAVQGLEECDFGQFEGKNYLELSDNPEYQAWIDSGGTLPFPAGESRAAFQKRCCQAIKQLVQQCHAKTIAVVAHGGTFMAVLSALEEQKIPYFDWKIPHSDIILSEKDKRSPMLGEVRY